MLFTGGKDSFLPHHHPLSTCCTLHLSTSYIQGPVCGCYLILSNLNMDKASSFQGIRKKKLVSGGLSGNQMTGWSQKYKRFMGGNTWER